MPAPVQPNPDAGRALERAVRIGADLLRTARDAARSAAATPPLDRRMAEERNRALARHAVAVHRHQARVAAARTTAWVGVMGVVGSGVAIAGDAPASELMWLVAAGGAALGISSTRRARRLAAAPPVAVLPPPPPARLRPGARGADAADRVAHALLHLYELIPALARLHPPAAAELGRAVAQVEPLLRGQVERLASLDRIEWEMPGSRAAQAAVAAGAEVSARLRAGADALEELIAAAARMLAAPDIADGVVDVLSPAIDSLEAFTAGLHAADAARLTNG